jgi:hypothetical protein
MGKEILRDVFFACAGVLMVIALIGLPGQGQSAGRQVQFQDAHLLPCLNCTTGHSRVQDPGPGGPSSQTP